MTSRIAGTLIVLCIFGLGANELVKWSEGVRCKQVTQDLMEIAWGDPDAYDFDNLKELGAGKYMCEAGGIPGGGYAARAITLCNTYLLSCRETK